MFPVSPLCSTTRCWETTAVFDISRKSQLLFAAKLFQLNMSPANISAGRLYLITGKSHKMTMFTICLMLMTGKDCLFCSKNNQCGCKKYMAFTEMRMHPCCFEIVLRVVIAGCFVAGIEFNLALNKPAFQSSDYASKSVPGKAVGMFWFAPWLCVQC